MNLVISNESLDRKQDTTEAWGNPSVHLTTKDVMDMKLALIHQSHENVLKDLISVLSDLTSPSNYEIFETTKFQYWDGKVIILNMHNI